MNNFGQHIIRKGDRILCWFSCGAASAQATKLTLDIFGADHPVVPVCCNTLINEHPDNARFMADCEKWFGVPIIRLSNPEYPTFAFPDDIHVFGFTADEPKRIAAFESRNPELNLLWILKVHNQSKQDCYLALMKAGIELPEMYKERARDAAQQHVKEMITLLRLREETIERANARILDLRRERDELQVKLRDIVNHDEFIKALQEKLVTRSTELAEARNERDKVTTKLAALDVRLKDTEQQREHYRQQTHRWRTTCREGTEAFNAERAARLRAEAQLQAFKFNIIDRLPKGSAADSILDPQDISYV